MDSDVVIVESTADPVYDLTTVEAVNAALGLTSSSSNDAEVAAQITSCSKIIAGFCGRIFAMQTLIETFRVGWSEPCKSLPLAQWPVIGNVSLIANDCALISGTDYKVDNIAGIIRTVHPHGYFRGILVATYTSGFDLPDNAPAELARACLEQIREQRFSTNRDPGIRNVSAGDASVSYFDPRTSTGLSSGAVSATVDGLISSYKRRVSV